MCFVQFERLNGIDQHIFAPSFSPSAKNFVSDYKYVAFGGNFWLKNRTIFTSKCPKFQVTCISVADGEKVGAKDMLIYAIQSVQWYQKQKTCIFF